MTVQKAMAPLTITHVIAADLDDPASEKLRVARDHQCAPCRRSFTRRSCQECTSLHAQPLLLVRACLCTVAFLCMHGMQAWRIMPLDVPS